MNFGSPDLSLKRYLRKTLVLQKEKTLIFLERSGKPTFILKVS